MLTSLQSAVQITAETAERHVELPVPAWVYGVGIMVVLIVMMFVTLAFMNLGNRHEAVEEHADPHKSFPDEQHRGHGEEKSHS